MVSKSSRQVKTFTGGGAREDKDGGPRTAHWVRPRYAVLPLRSTWLPSIARRFRARHRPGRRSSFQPSGGRDGFTRRPTDLRRLNLCRQRRWSCVPSLASCQFNLLNLDPFQKAKKLKLKSFPRHNGP